MVIDPTTNIGRMRLRVGDCSDLPYFQDAVYQSTLADNDNNVVRASGVMAKYILATLSFQTQRQMGLQLHVWGAEAFKNYKEFLILTTTNPAFMDLSPMPYSASGTEKHPLVNFQETWNKAFYAGTDTQQLNFVADLSPNDGGRYGTAILGDNGSTNYIGYPG